MAVMYVPIYDLKKRVWYVLKSDEDSSCCARLKLSVPYIPSAGKLRIGKLNFYGYRKCN